jgi:hypothetical protein
MCQQMSEEKRVYAAYAGMIVPVVIYLKVRKKASMSQAGFRTFK